MLVVIAAMGFIVKTTVFARHVEAIGDNYRASKLSGVNIPFVITCVYVLCGALSGVAGIMEAARINSVNAASLGLMVELDAIAAVAIGGTPFSGGKARILIRLLIKATFDDPLVIPAKAGILSYHSFGWIPALRFAAAGMT
jgi:ribose/xylose/arabinose/galactoside ABC-type transport system permease subunit